MKLEQAAAAEENEARKLEVGESDNNNTDPGDSGSVHAE